MAVTEPVSLVRSRPRRHRVGLALLIVGCGMMLVCVVMIAVALVPGFTQSMTSTPYALPMDATLSLKPGSWVIFEQTGTSQQSGPITISQNRSPRLALAQVTITDSAGASVLTYQTAGVQTINRNGETYTGVAAFDARASGPFTVHISDVAGGQVLISPNIEGLFAAAGVWFVTLVPAMLFVGIGITLAVSGRARKPLPSSVLQASRASSTQPPGWYPDRSKPGRMVWWDGAHWHLPDPDASGPRRGQ